MDADLILKQYVPRHMAKLDRLSANLAAMKEAAVARGHLLPGEEEFLTGHTEELTELYLQATALIRQCQRAMRQAGVQPERPAVAGPSAPKRTRGTLSDPRTVALAVQP